MPHQNRQFLAEISALLRVEHYSLRTEQGLLELDQAFVLLYAKQQHA